MNRRDFMTAMPVVPLVFVGVSLADTQLKVRKEAFRVKMTNKEEGEFLWHLKQRTSAERVRLVETFYYKDSNVPMNFRGMGPHCYHFCFLPKINKPSIVLSWRPKLDPAQHFCSMEEMIATARNYNNWGTPVKKLIF